MTNNGKKLVILILLIIIGGVSLSYISNKVNKKPLASDPVSDQINLEVKENTATLDSVASSTDSETLEQ
ncbi:MAG: hypothetical protein WCO58_02720 [bacterium]